MKLAVLQGIWAEEEQSTLQGYSRVTPAQDTAINGFSRVNFANTDPQALQGLMLSGLMLSGKKPTAESMEDFACYVELCQGHNMPMSSESYGQYMMQGKAERKARREARRRRKEERKIRRARRDEARTGKRERGEGLLSTIKGVAGDIFGGDGDFDIMDYSDVAEEFIPGAGDIMSMVAGGGQVDSAGNKAKAGEVIDPEDGLFKPKGYVFGTPPFEPWTQRWWKSKKVPMWQKAGIGVGGLVGVDQLVLKGKFTNPIIGLNKGKARK